MKKNTPLLKLRRSKSLKQSDIATVLGISQAHYANLEMGKKPLTLNNAKILSKYYGVSITQLSDELSDSKFISDSLFNDTVQLHLPFYSTKNPLSTILNEDDMVLMEEATLVSEPEVAYNKSDLAIIELNGNNMADRYRDGTRFLGTLVRREDYSFQTGLVAIGFSDHFNIYRIKNNELRSKKTLTLHSDNPNFGAFDVGQEDIVLIYKLKKVIWSDVD